MADGSLGADGNALVSTAAYIDDRVPGAAVVVEKLRAAAQAVDTGDAALDNLVREKLDALAVAVGGIGQKTLQGTAGNLRQHRENFAAVGNTAKAG